jgi:HTH-type transcriptional regulator / antitoxin HipB
MLVRQPLDLGILIKERRLELRWSQDFLAKRAQVGRQWLMEVERGKKGAPLGLVIKTLSALSYVLDVSADVAAQPSPRSEAVNHKAILPDPCRKDDGSHPGEEVLSNNIEIAIALDGEDTAPWPAEVESPHTAEIERDDFASAKAAQGTDRAGKSPARSAAENDARLEAAVRSGDFDAVVSAFLADLLEDETARPISTTPNP